MDASKCIKIGANVNSPIFQFIVDSPTDLPADHYNFGSIALVIHGYDEKMQLYVADKTLEWIPGPTM